MAGAAKPVDEGHGSCQTIILRDFLQPRVETTIARKGKDAIPPVIAINVPPVNAAAPIIPPRLHLAHLLLEDSASSLDSWAFNKAIAEQATMVSIAS